MWGIIGGSGFENFDQFEIMEDLNRDTPFGLASTSLKKVKLDGKECLFLSRHGEKHELNPSEVNYAANIYALKKHGARKIMAFSAIGSLKREFKPGDMVVPFQFIDRTKSLRKQSFSGEGFVSHVSLAKPMCRHFSDKVQLKETEFDFDLHFGATHVTIEGPNFSTQAESISYRQMGATTIGMTSFPEYALVREAGMHYVPCYFVTDYDCWDDSIPHVTLDEVIKVMKENNSKAFQVASFLINENDEDSSCECRDSGLKSAIMTPKNSIPVKISNWLNVLLN